MPESISVRASKLNNKGVFAAKDFRKGDVVLRWQSNKILTKDDVEALPASEKHYVSNYTPGELLLQGEPERYVNHSCDPNTEVHENSDVAIRDIAKEEEITTDYSVAHIQQHFKCTCGSANCKGYI